MKIGGKIFPPVCMSTVLYIWKANLLAQFINEGIPLNKKILQSLKAITFDQFLKCPFPCTKNDLYEIYLFPSGYLEVIGFIMFLGGAKNNIVVINESSTL